MNRRDPLTHYTLQLEEAEAALDRSDLDLVREAEARNVFYLEAGHAQFEALLAETAAGERP